MCSTCILQKTYQATTIVKLEHCRLLLLSVDCHHAVFTGLHPPLQLAKVLQHLGLRITQAHVKCRLIQTIASPKLLMPGQLSPSINLAGRNLSRTVMT